MPNGWTRILWHDDILEPAIGVVKNLCLRLPIEMLRSCGRCKIDFGHGTDVLALDLVKILLGVCLYVRQIRSFAP